MVPETPAVLNAEPGAVAVWPGVLAKSWQLWFGLPALVCTIDEASTVWTMPTSWKNRASGEALVAPASDGPAAAAPARPRARATPAPALRIIEVMRSLPCQAPEGGRRRPPQVQRPGYDGKCRGGGERFTAPAIQR